MFNFKHERHLYANCFFYILAIYLKCLIFEFSDCAIPTHISITIRVQKWHISGYNNDHILLKVLLRFSFQDEDHLYAISFFHVLGF